MSKSVNQMSKAERIAFYNSPEGKALDKKTHQHECKRVGKFL